MKARIAFDTLAYANRLKAAGVDTKIAEAQAEASADMVAGLLDDTLATKSDLTREITKIEQQIRETRSDLEKQFIETRSDLEKQIIETRLEARTNIKELETRLTMRLGGIVIGGLTVVTAVLSALRVMH